MADQYIINMGEFTTTIRFVGPEEALALPGEERSLQVSDVSIASWLGLRDHLPEASLVLFPPGEGSKEWATVEACIQKAMALGLGRDDLLVGIGGGVITDVASFAASLYMRGIRLRLVPTTLLAMVDAAFGGKTGINFGGYKNMVGTFYPASELLVCPSFLGSLPEREYRSGLAEVIKSALLGDEDLLADLTSRAEAVRARDPGMLRRMVEGSLMVKARHVEADLREGGIRAHLNLGHTFAHALESVAGLGQWSHGEAVAWGMVKAARLSVLIGLAPDSYHAKVRNLVAAYGFSLNARVEPRLILDAMRSDKKKKAGQVRFVLQEGPGATSVRPVEDALVLQVLSLAE